MKTIDLPPYAPTLIESTRAIGYSFETAIADVIDNSIAAQATSIEITLLPTSNPYLAILDDGIGMNAEEIDRAMQYGSKNPNDVRSEVDLGRFGLGLKTASLSQCRILTVVSKQNGKIEARRWDIDHVAKTGTWSLIILEDDEIEDIPEIETLQHLSCGTLIVWQNLDRLLSGGNDISSVLREKLTQVSEHLALVFHRYLSGEKGIQKIDIKMNQRPIMPIDPFLKEKSVQVMDDEYIALENEKILVRPYILPHFSKMTSEELKKLGGQDGLKKDQGFYIYRNKRLLIWGTWFKMQAKAELSKLARIQVDIPNTLDHLWTLDIKKSKAIPPMSVKQNLRMVMSNLAAKSKRTYTFRGKREISDKEIRLWERKKGREGGYFYELNRNYPILQRLYEQYPNLRRVLDTMFIQIEQEIPVNQIFVDLSQDIKVENETKYSETDIMNLLDAVISFEPNTSMKLKKLEQLASIYPYSQYSAVIDVIREKLIYEH